MPAFEPITAALNIGEKLIDRLWPDPAERDRAKLELFKLQQEGELQQIAGQTEVNKVEAASSSTFVAGWRPFIGWVCGAALSYAYIGYPMMVWVASIVRPEFKPPPLGLDDMLFQLMLGMLGLGGLRTYEKVKGAA